MSTVQETIAALLETDTQLAGLKAKRERLRDELAAEARRRWEADGAVPSWRAPRLGTVTLAGTESVSAQVEDEKAYTEWAAQERTESVTVTLTLPASAVTGKGEPMERAGAVGELLVAAAKAGAESSWHVHPGVLDGLVKHGRTDPDTGQLWSEEGDVVPGVVVRRKEPFLQVRLDPEAKRRAVAEVEREAFTGEGAAAIEAAEQDAPVVASSDEAPPRGSPEWYQAMDAVFGEA